MDFLLGLLLPVSFIWGWTGVAIPAQWTLLSLMLLPSLWQRAQITSFHWIGLAFVAYAASSLVWSPSPRVSVDAVWFVVVAALSFWWGSLRPDLLGLWKGLAFGMAINSMIAIIHSF